MVLGMIHLLLLTATCGQSADMPRLAYKPGYSVVMPRPFLKRDQRIGPAYVAVSKERIYIVSSATLSPSENAEMQKAKTMGVDAYQRFLDSYAVNFSMASNTLKREAGAFHGMPCIRRLYEVKSGERGAMIAIFNGEKIYILVCVNPPGDTTFNEAQRFFDSFRLERSVAADPDLGDPPPGEEHYPPADANTGTV